MMLAMDWKTMLNDLRSAGISQEQIGARLGKSQAWVSAAMAGKYDDLKWSDGQALRRFHASVMRKVRAAA